MLTRQFAEQFERALDTREIRYNNVPPGAIMEMFKVTHMKSIPIITNHMPAQIYRYLMDTLVTQVLPDVSSVGPIDTKRPLKFRSCEAGSNTLAKPSVKLICRTEGI